MLAMPTAWLQETCFLLSFLLLISYLPGPLAVNETASPLPVTGLVPVDSIRYRIMVGELGPQRRRLAPFQLCLLCRCCSSALGGGNCTTMPCCFGIDCQLPDRPFGICAFVPKTCRCSTCGGT